MPAVNFRVRWPDGREHSAYSPSTVIYEHLHSGRDYELAEFMAHAEAGLKAAAERVRQVRGFSCSAAMDCLAALQAQAQTYNSGTVRVLGLHTDD